jgi:hypothetical protein
VGLHTLKCGFAHLHLIDEIGLLKTNPFIIFKFDSFVILRIFFFFFHQLGLKFSYPEKDQHTY